MLLFNIFFHICFTELFSKKRKFKGTSKKVFGDHLGSSTCIPFGMVATLPHTKPPLPLGWADF